VHTQFKSEKTLSRWAHCFSAARYYLLQRGAKLKSARSSSYLQKCRRDQHRGGDKFPREYVFLLLARRSKRAKHRVEPASRRRVHVLYLDENSCANLSAAALFQDLCKLRCKVVSSSAKISSYSSARRTEMADIPFKSIREDPTLCLLRGAYVLVENPERTRRRVYVKTKSLLIKALSALPCRQTFLLFRHKIKKR
jgi:hypothetical protein